MRALIAATLLVASACAELPGEEPSTCTINNYTWSCPDGQVCSLECEGACFRAGQVDCGGCLRCDAGMRCIDSGMKCIDPMWCFILPSLCPA